MCQRGGQSYLFLWLGQAKAAVAQWPIKQGDFSDD
jgi:hypothetical protein